MAPFDEAPSGIKLEVGYHQPQVYVKEKQVAFTTTFLFKVNAAQGQTVMVLAADTELMYEMLEAATTDVQVQRAASFAQSNGAYHVWPYWRELVGTSLTRLGLPPVRLPLVYSEQLSSFIITSPGEISDAGT